MLVSSYSDVCLLVFYLMDPLEAARKITKFNQIQNIFKISKSKSKQAERALSHSDVACKKLGLQL